MHQCYVNVSSFAKERLAILPLVADSSHHDEMSFTCKFCSKEFLDDRELGKPYKKVARQLFGEGRRE